MSNPHSKRFLTDRALNNAYNNGGKNIFLLKMRDKKKIAILENE